MLRGLVMFSKAQITELMKVVSAEKFKETLLYVKIASANNQHMEHIPLELSEEEAEMLLDEMEPDPKNEIRNILTATVLSWRS